MQSLPDAVLRPPAAANAFESTVERLAAAIRLGVFEDGEQLPPERELAVQLGVTRLNLRDAIAALREADMVTTRRGRGGGTIVRYPGSVAGSTARSGSAGRDGQDRAAALDGREPQLADALNFRRVVEPGAAYLAATRELSAEQRAWLAACESEVHAADAARPERADLAVGHRVAHRTADSRLHLAIATLSGSPMLIESVTRAQAALHDMLAAIPILPRNISHSHRQHHAIVGAILTRDADAARRAMEEHCDATAALLRGLLQLDGLIQPVERPARTDVTAQNGVQR